MKSSQNCINLIKKFEGCQLKAYLCPAKVWTIGFGHTEDVRSGQVITQAQAESFLKSDLVKYEKKVLKYSKYNWTQNEFDALVSFAYNIGSIDGLTAKGKRSKAQISRKLLEYNKADGEILNGLTRRRQAEKAMFDSNSTSANSSTSDPNVKKIQLWLNSKYKANLLADGICGAKTKAALQSALRAEGSPTIRKGDKNNAVYIVQAMLYCLGYDPNGIDGVFGAGTEKALKAYQKANGLVADGVAGKNTYGKMF